MKIILNPDPNEAAIIQQAIRENDGYCPCAAVKNTDTLCMCKNFREDINEGYCHCGLYCKINEINIEVNK